MPKRHVDEGVQALYKVEIIEDNDKELPCGGKSTFQMLTQEYIVLSKFHNLDEDRQIRLSTD